MEVNNFNNLNSTKTYEGNTGNYSAANDVTTNEKVAIPEVNQTEKKQAYDEEKDKIDKKELDKALAHLNKFLEPEKTHAEYAIHKDLGTLMIKIVDDETKETILEAPPKKILDMIASLLREDGLLDKKA